MRKSFSDPLHFYSKGAVFVLPSHRRVHFDTNIGIVLASIQWPKPFILEDDLKPSICPCWGISKPHPIGADANRHDPSYHLAPTSVSPMVMPPSQSWLVPQPPLTLVLIEIPPHDAVLIFQDHPKPTELLIEGVPHILTMEFSTPLHHCFALPKSKAQLVGSINDSLRI